MYVGNRIKELLTERKQTNKELLKYLGTTCNSSLTQLTNGNPTAQRLEMLADFFGVPIDYFFDRGNDVNLSKSEADITIASLKEKIKLLEELISEKNERINLLEHLLKIEKPDKSD